MAELDGSRFRWAAITAGFLALALVPPAGAATIRIDSSTPGTAFDGLVDGFPGIAPLDGNADIGANALGVGLKPSVTEERGVAELPLAPLAGVTATAVTSATLTFNIDDVLSTFGPGTDFDGTAAERIAVVVYPGDGQVTLDDFQRGQAAPAAIVDTSSAGTISDASLATSGPIRFTVDVKAALQGLLAGGATHMGVVFVTDDANTGTSLDDLGLGGAGPPGVGGATLPFLVVNTSGPQPTPTPGGGPTPTPAPRRTPGPDPGPSSPIGVRPDALGDQVVLYYDARDAFTTFLNLRNDADGALTVVLKLYGPDLAAAVTETLTLPAGGTRTIDAAGVRTRGLPAQFGLALASAVDGDGRPIVTRALSGSFTVANLQTISAWGAPGAARRALAITASGVSTPALGTVIDGESVVLRAIRPELLALAVFYNPETLEPAEHGGHQLIFLSFNDVAGVAAGATTASTTWDVAATRNTGEPIDPPALTVSGVRVSDLLAVGGEAVLGQAGGMLFGAEPSGAYNRMIFFSESLGTFATGYMLPVVTQ